MHSVKRMEIGRWPLPISVLDFWKPAPLHPAGLLLQLPDTPYAGNAQQPQKNREKALDEKRNDQAEQAGDQNTGQPLCVK